LVTGDLARAQIWEAGTPVEREEGERQNSPRGRATAFCVVLEKKKCEGRAVKI